MRKLCIGVLLCFISAGAFAIDTQQVINPVNKNTVWSLTQEDCGNDSSKGVIRENGKPIGCWWTNLTAENVMAKNVWFLVYGKVYSFPTSQLEQYNGTTSLPWQTMREINNAYRGSRPAYTPPAITNYYGSGSGYLGYSVSQ